MMTLMIKKILILGKKEEQNTNVDEIRDISSNEYNYIRKKKKTSFRMKLLPYQGNKLFKIFHDIIYANIET